MFRIEYDRPANLVRITVKGFWEPHDVPPFAAAIDSAAREAAVVGGNFNVLVESFDFPVQANDVADLLTGVMQRGISMTTGRAAIVVGSQLNKLQAERTLFHPRVQVFRSMFEAEDWLAG
ncbi:hypothetical protein P1X14_14850 [Sphingomonas sp. AOB5]|uniref:hypothetical protein n=1 Tax=Sphingomonas sp. AOB5 TaxID=3034017 RepID=UPI0023F77DF3|nr:hypothetical protein [Sphingomonas sp. AOB5]MDF7776532.1 hypothetical protein [Sphingomonas sp. AOB5]